MSAFLSHKIVTEDGISIVFVDSAFNGINFNKNIQDIDARVMLSSNTTTESLIGMLALHPFEAPTGVMAFTRETLDDFDSMMIGELGMTVDSGVEYTFILLMPMVEVPADDYIPGEQ